MPNFRITYDGPALESHEMDVRELAPALLAVGDLLEASAAVLYGKDTKVKTSVIGSFKTGSFGIDFNIGGDLLNRAIDLLTSRETNAAMNLLALLGFIYSAKDGVISILKKLRGRKIIKASENGNKVILHVDDEAYEIESEVFALLKDRLVRECTEKVIAPIKTDGIDAVYFSKDKTPESGIQKHEADWFNAPKRREDVMIVNEEHQNAFSIVSLTFKEDNKWRLSDGNAIINVSILDEEFLRKVDNREISFTKGDILVCDVRNRQWQTQDGIKSEYEVLKVLEHKPAPKQTDFIF